MYSIVLILVCGSVSVVLLGHEAQKATLESGQQTDHPVLCLVKLVQVHIVLFDVTNYFVLNIHIT